MPRYTEFFRYLEQSTHMSLEEAMLFQAICYEQKRMVVKVMKDLPLALSPLIQIEVVMC